MQKCAEIWTFLTIFNTVSLQSIFPLTLPSIVLYKSEIRIYNYICLETIFLPCLAQGKVLEWRCPTAHTSAEEEKKSREQKH